MLGVGDGLKARDELAPVLTPSRVSIDVGVVDLVRRAARRTLRWFRINTLLAVFIRRLAELFARHEFRVSAQQNVGSAASHVGGHRDRAQSSRLRYDQRLALVLLRVQNVILDLPLLQHFEQSPRMALNPDQVIEQRQ